MGKLSELRKLTDKEKWAEFNQRFSTNSNFNSNLNIGNYVKEIKDDLDLARSLNKKQRGAFFSIEMILPEILENLSDDDLEKLECLDAIDLMSEEFKNECRFENIIKNHFEKCFPKFKKNEIEKRENEILSEPIKRLKVGPNG